MTTSQKILLLIILALSIATVCSQPYAAIYFSSKLDCRNKADRFLIEATDENCKNFACKLNGPLQNVSSSEQYISWACNASLADFDQMLLEQGSGRNISITWYYTTYTTCGDGWTYNIDATAVDSCEGIEEFTCKDNKSTRKCIYVDPNSPKTEIPSSQPDQIQTPESAIIHEDNQLTTFEKIMIGISIGGWAAAVLFIALFIRGRNNRSRGYDPLEQEEEAKHNQNEHTLVLDDHNNMKQPENAAANAKILRISETEVTITAKRLGTGQCSEVFEGVWRQRPVAVKKPKAMDSGLLSELAIHREIDQHPNIVEIYGYFKKDGRIYLVVELCDSQNLESTILRGDLSAAEKYSVVAGIAEGMAHLHRKSIVHRDLKPNNILLTKKGLFMVPKIADFDYSRFLASQTSAQSFSTPQISYAAPEAITQGEFSFQSDVWSYGATIFFLLTKQPPFGQPSGLQKKRMQKQAKINFELLEKLPKDPFTQLLVEIVMKCLKDEPNERPNFDQICSQYKAFFNDFLPWNNNQNNNNL